MTALEAGTSTGRMSFDLGTDGSGANDNLIMHEAMRAVAVAHRSGQPDRSRWITASDVLQMATTGGAAALRHQKLGRISPGFAADLVVYRLNAPWWAPVNDIVNQMVFAETGAGVDTVVIDGRVVVANSVVTTFDVDALLLFSYPLHPPNKPELLRTAHFPQLHTPALFVHGTRDPFGSIEELRAAAALIPARTDLLAVEGSAHDLKRAPDLAQEIVTRLRVVLC